MNIHPLRDATLLVVAAVLAGAAVLLMLDASSGENTMPDRKVQVVDPCGRIVRDSKGEPILVTLDDGPPDLTPVSEADPGALPRADEENVPVVGFPADPRAAARAQADCSA